MIVIVLVLIMSAYMIKREYKAIKAVRDEIDRYEN
jgi:hypothetical protein